MLPVRGLTPIRGIASLCAKVRAQRKQVRSDSSSISSCRSPPQAGHARKNHFMCGPPFSVELMPVTLRINDPKGLFGSLQGGGYGEVLMTISQAFRPDVH